MKCNDILNKLYEIMPLRYACDWDNPGFQVGDQVKEVHTIVVALDLTDECIDEAIDKKADFIISHHPLLYKPIKMVTTDDIYGKRILRLAASGISYAAMHTNYDSAPTCMGDICAQMIGIKPGLPVGTLLTEKIKGRERKIGIGAVGDLPKPMTVDMIANLVKKKFNLPHVRIYGSHLYDDKIRRVAISPGSGSGMYVYAKEQGAKVLISGDISHHEGLDASEAGIAVIDAGHYGLEHIFIDDMASRLRNICSKNIKIYTYKAGVPETII